MMRARGLVVAMVLGLALAPAAAWGKCAMPSAVIVPTDGAALPPKPVLYVFVPGLGAKPPDTLPLSITGPLGAKVPFRLSPLGAVNAFVAYRVDVGASSGTRISVKLKQRMYRDVVIERSYFVTDKWRRPPSGGTIITRVERESRQWTCSHQLSRNLTPSRFAPAYRVEWAATEKEWRDGKRGRLFLPYSKREFWNWRSEKVPQAALLELGHLDCMGSTFEWRGKALFVGVAALHPDGSEDPPVAEPVHVSPP